jgi:cellulose synthase/poly-beta-1,6-N-acetylglucosamine synthase-like glycosyltransferase
MVEISIYYLLPGILGIVRWGIWFILKAIPALLYKPIKIPDTTRLTPKDVTLVVPTYQPDKASYIESLKSWIASGAYINIVADETCYEEIVHWTKNDVDAEEGMINVICESKPGKRLAMYNGLRKTTTEICIFVDDDTMWDGSVLPNILAAFENPKIAGVGTKQIVRPKNLTKTITESFADMRLSLRYVEVRATVYMTGYCSCLSGRTAAYRTKVLERHDFDEFFLNDKFRGDLQNSGDDKCLTRFIFTQPDVTMYSQITEACIVSTQFEEWSTYVQQTIRWARNTWRSDIMTLTSHTMMWKKGTWLCFVMCDRIICGLFLLVIALINDPDPMLLLIWYIWIVSSRSIKLIPHFIRQPKDLRIMPLFVLFNYFTAIINIYALCTLSNRSWLTRSVKVDKNNKIVRKPDKNIKKKDETCNKENKDGADSYDKKYNHDGKESKSSSNTMIFEEIIVNKPKI